MVTVRQAEVEDIPRIMDLGEEMCEESPLFSRYTQDFAKQYKVLVGVITSTQSCVFIADDGTGMFIGHVEPLPWFTEYIAVEDVFFVSKEHRHSRRAWLLLQAFEDWSKQQGAHEIRTGITTGVSVELTSRLYEKLGYEQAGVLFRKEL